MGNPCRTSYGTYIYYDKNEATFIFYTNDRVIGNITTTYNKLGNNNYLVQLITNNYNININYNLTMFFCS